VRISNLLFSACLSFLPHDATHSAVLWVVCPSVCPWRWGIMSTGWNTSKIISRLVSLGIHSLQNPTSWTYSKGNNWNFAGIMGGVLKKRFRFKEASISLKRGKIGPRLLLRTNWNSHMSFRVVPKSTSLDDIEGPLCTLFQKNVRHGVVIKNSNFTFNLLLGNKWQQRLLTSC